MSVLFASERDKAESTARLLVQEASIRKLSLALHCMSELGCPSLRIVSPGTLVCVVAAGADGSLPEAGKRFTRWVLGLSPDALAGLKFALLGLSNSSSANSQIGAKSLESALKAKGAVALLPRGEANSQHDFKPAVDRWFQSLWKPLGVVLTDISDSKVERRTLEAVIGEETLIVDSRILARRVLTETNAGVKIVEMTLDSCGRKPSPGAYIYVYPDNDLAAVSEVLARLNFDANHIIETSALLHPSIRWRADLPCNLFELFQHYVDISSPVSLLFAEHFASRMRNQEEQSELKQIITECDGSTLPRPYSLLYLLQTYIDLDYLFVEETVPILPPLAARSYSVASCALVLPDSLNIACAVTGVCSTYLDKLSSLDIAQRPVLLRVAFPREENAFWKPVLDGENPLIITAGVGLAPFRGMLEHISLMGRKPVWVIHCCSQPIKSSESHDYDLCYEEDIRGFTTLLGGKISVITKAAGEATEAALLAALQTAKDEVRGWAKIAAFCGRFATRDMSEFLHGLIPGITILAEEWD